ncbi:MAG: hypothetical protein O2826_08295 [Chloroflexi bacterium]|nr:hypothetical protein [Chloroflexota bacterium]MDA1174500.1 hypothetical protein [Chloroflexota bacterium]
MLDQQAALRSLPGTPAIDPFVEAPRFLHVLAALALAVAVSVAAVVEVEMLGL